MSIVMPCLNEAQTLETCIRKAQGVLREHNVPGEVFVGDNGSTDGARETSAAIAPWPAPTWRRLAAAIAFGLLVLSAGWAGLNVARDWALSGMLIFDDPKLAARLKSDHRFAWLGSFANEYGGRTLHVLCPTTR